ncbi:MAG: hotdog fold thioesterase [Rhodothermia bacterium]|nr:MAG: hotdog fold thioesterase [Rhodothermia bacterium]
MISHIGIEFVEIGDDFLRARMPVDERTTQPLGLLHGGASVALAETLGNTAAHCTVEENQYCVGIEINANHIRRATSGMVVGIARPVHLGKKTQVWEAKIRDSEDRLVSTSRMTLAVLQKE